MAAGDLSLFHGFKLNHNNGNDVIDFDTDTLRIMLLTVGYTVDLATQNFVSEVSTNEVTAGSAYADGGPALANVTVTDEVGITVIDADDVQVLRDSSTGFTDATQLVVYKDTGVATNSRLIAHGDLGSARGNVDGSLSLIWNANGLFRF